MNSRFLKILIIVLAVAAGWWLGGGIGGSPPATRHDPASSPKRPVSSASASAGTPASSSRSWNGPVFPLEDFEGIHEIPYGTALNIEHFWNDKPIEPLLFNNQTSFETLANWLDLKPTERHSLREILRRAAHRQLDWEKANLKAVRLEPGRHQVRWREPGTEIPEALRQELRDAFGETLARSLWIRGGLDRFSEPVPGWKRRGMEEIDLQITPDATGGDLNARITSGDFAQVRRLPSDDPQLPSDDPQAHFPLRLRHIFDVKDDAAELLAKLPQHPEPGAIPVAKWLKPGFVTNPFNGKVVDVRDIPPGTLVQDPSLPSDAKAYFRVPEPE